MEMGKRSYQEMSGGGDDGEEHDAKRSSAIVGGGDDDEELDEAISDDDDEELDAAFSDDDDDGGIYVRTGQRSPSPELDFPRSKARQQLPVYDVETLDLHIKHFDKEPSIFDGLQKRVTSGIDDQKTWFTELRKVWKGTKSREEAARLVIDVLKQIYHDHVQAGDMLGFLDHYGLPSPWDLYIFDLFADQKARVDQAPTK